MPHDSLPPLCWRRRAPICVRRQFGRARNALLTLGALTLASCSHQWAPTAGRSAADLEATKARCSAVSKEGDSGFFAFGPLPFVALAAVGHAIGEAARSSSAFDDCMIASGWQVADDHPTTSPPAKPVIGETWNSALVTNQPIAARTTADTASSMIASADGRLRLATPPGWMASKPPTVAAQDTSIFASNPALDATILVTVVNRSDVSDPQDYAESLQSALITKLSDAHSSAVQAVDVTGRRSFRFEYDGTLKGMRLHFMATLIPSDTRIARVVVWSMASQFEHHRADLERLIEGLSEVTTSGSAQ